MNVLIVNTHDHHGGGAGKAAYRLKQGLDAIGVYTRMLVQHKVSNEVGIVGPTTKPRKALAVARHFADQLPLVGYRIREKYLFSPCWLPDSLTTKVRSYGPDVLHLHWIAGGFVRPESLRRTYSSLVWTLHDMWAFTGGCHYDAGCDRFVTGCGRCPVLGSNREQDLAHWVFSRKRKAWTTLDLTVVCPSRWLATCASKSALLGRFRTEVIPNGLDLRCYRPMDKVAARSLVGLPADRQVVLFGAAQSTTDPRKGFRELQAAMHHLANSRWRDSLTLVVFGATAPSRPPDFGLPVQYLGTLHDDISLVAVYSAADVFVAPSRQENLSNTVMEALACGTPCVAFDIGGMPDMIEHKQNGYLATPYDARELADGIAWVLEDRARWEALSHRARRKVEKEYELTHIARRYRTLYEELLTRRETCPS